MSASSGAVGASVTIAGSNFGASQGASTVTFNGTAATPTSWSASSIVAAVPAGASTGNVVVTVSGVASNGLNFTASVPDVNFIQGDNATTETPQTTATVTYTAPQQAGGLNIVVVGWNDSTAQVQSVTDTVGNAYSLAVGPTVQPGVATQAIYYAKNIVAATANQNTVTVTFTQAATSADVRIAEYSGLDTTNPLDVSTAAQGNGTLSDSGSVTTTNGNDLLVAANQVQTGTSGAGTGYTTLVITSPDADLLEDRVVTAAGNYNATAPISSSGQWIMQMVAFRMAANGGANTPQLSVNPATLNFGSVVVGTSASLTATLSATGSSVTLSSAIVGTSEFTLSGLSFPLVLAAGQSAPFTVAFAPQSSGTVSDSITFVSNATNSPNIETLTGTGQAASGTSTVNQYEFVFTDGTLYIYSIDTLSSTPVKTVNIPTATGTRGSVACVGTKAIYVSYGGDGGVNGNGGLAAISLTDFSVTWTKQYTHGIDSHAITTDCSKIYMPDGELASASGVWHVVDPSNGNEIGSITSSSFGPHNTIVHNGNVYLGGRYSSVFQSARTSDNSIGFTSNSIPAPGNGGAGKGVRPFTINSAETAAYLTQTCPAPCSTPVLDVVNLTNGSVTQLALPSAACTSGSCPSTPNHGIAMSADEQKLYVIDAINNAVYVFDIGGANMYSPQMVDTVHLMHNLGGKETPCAYDCLGDGWLHISHEGKYLFVGDSGDVIDLSASPPNVVAYFPQMQQSRKEIEIDCDTSVPISTGCNPVFAMNNRSSIGGR